MPYGSAKASFLVCLAKYTEILYLPHKRNDDYTITPCGVNAYENFFGALFVSFEEKNGFNLCHKDQFRAIEKTLNCRLVKKSQENSAPIAQKLGNKKYAKNC